MSEFKETTISSLGGMARIVKADGYFDCPPWIVKNKWEKYRESYKDASEGRESLIQVDLELADNCNYRCLECPISDNLKGRKINKLKDDEIDFILKTSANNGALALKLNYINEPMLDVDRLLRTAEKAYEYGFVDVYFTTNGSLLNDKNALRLIESELISRIQVSVDAFTEETYNIIRRGGDFLKVKNQIKNFIKLRKNKKKCWPKIRVSFLTFPENKHEMNSFYEYWERIVDAVALQSSVMKPNSDRKNNEKGISKTEDLLLSKPF